MAVFCIHCGHINDDTVKVCESCGFKYDKRTYKRLMGYAKQAVKYGYDYRKAYEEQIKIDNEIYINYKLPEPDSLYQWLALAALSGVVGNVAYDIVKKLAKKFYHKVFQLKENKRYDEIRKFLSDDKQLEIFTNYIREYYNNFPDINPKVKKAIEQEIFLDNSYETLEETRELMSAFDSDRKKYLQLYKKYRVRAKKRVYSKMKNKPSISEWNKILSGFKHK